MHTFLRPRRLAGSRGFTLVELMIVLLIVGVLVALGLAKFAPATGAAKTTKAKTALKRAAEDAQAYYAVGRTMDGLAEGDLEDVRVNEIVDQSADPATSSAEDCTPENLNASVTAAIGTLHYCAHGDVFAAITGSPNGTVGSAGIGGVSPLAAGELDVWGIRSTEDGVEAPSKLSSGGEGGGPTCYTGTPQLPDSETQITSVCVDGDTMTLTGVGLTNSWGGNQVAYVFVRWASGDVASTYFGSLFDTRASAPGWGCGTDPSMDCHLNRPFSVFSATELVVDISGIPDHDLAHADRIQLLTSTDGMPQGLSDPVVAP